MPYPAMLKNLVNPDGIPYLQDDGAILDLPNLHGYHSSAQVRAIRDVYKQHFSCPQGSLTWQDRELIS